MFDHFPPTGLSVSSTIFGSGDTVQLDKNLLLGFLTSAGSPSGHTAILARTMGIPVGAGDVLKPKHEGREAIKELSFCPKNQHIFQ